MVAKKRLGAMLVDAGVIDEAQLRAALGHQRKWGGKLGQALIDLQLATEPEIVTALAAKFGYEAVDVAGLRPSPALDLALSLVPHELALRHTIVPIAADASTLTLAMGDPSNIAVVDEISFRTGRRVKVALAGDREIAAAVRRLYSADELERSEPITLDEILLEPVPLEPIQLEATSDASDAPLETTRDPFAALPTHVREGYFAGYAHGADDASAAPPSAEPVLATDLLVDVSGAPLDGEQSERQLTPRQSAVLDELARVARGESSALVTPARLAAALAKLLVRRGLISEVELADELSDR